MRSRPADHPQPRPEARNNVFHGPDVIRMCEVASKPVHWLWEQRIARGKLTLIAGDPGLGKSYLTLDLAARVSTGRAMPGDVWRDGRPMDEYPGVAILLSAEDDPGDTLRPRLEAAGARLENIALVQGVRTGNHTRTFNLKEDLKFLRGMCKHDSEVKLIVIDPISAYLGDDEGHSNTKVRNLLSPLAQLAQEFNVAVVAVTHLNKGAGGGQSAIYRTMGSLAFTAAARTVHLVARDPDDPERRLMLPVKNNLGQDRTGYGFILQQTDLADAVIEWDDQPMRESADELLSRIANTREFTGSTNSPRRQAATWLSLVLSEGPVATAQVEEEAKSAGISMATLRRAREQLGVQSVKRGGNWYMARANGPHEPTIFAKPLPPIDPDAEQPDTAA